MTTPRRKIKLWLKLSGLFLLALLALASGILLLNTTDTPPSPAVQTILDRKVICPAQSQGSHAEPLDTKAKLLEHDPSPNFEVTGKFLWQESYLKIKEQIPTLLTEYQELLSLQDAALTKGPICQPIKDVKDPSQYASHLELALFRAWKLRALEYNQLIHTGNAQPALLGLQQLFAFHLASLEFPNSIFSTMLHVAALRSIRVFVNEAAVKSEPFKAALTPDAQKSFQAQLSSSALLDQALSWELMWIELVAQADPTARAHLSYFLPRSRTFAGEITRALMHNAFSLTPHRLQNSIYQCWHNKGETTAKNKYLHPGIWYFSQIACTQTAGRMVKIAVETEDLRAPFRL